MDPHDKALQMRRKRHRSMLAIAVFVIFMSFVLDVRGPEEQVAVTAFPNCPLPSLCLSQSLFHVSCPGCGLTRSFIYLAHGDLQSSLRMHRVGWLMALAVLLQIPYRIASLVLPGREVLGLMFPKIFGNVLITLLIGNWLFNLVVGYL